MDPKGDSDQDDLVFDYRRLRNTRGLDADEMDLLISTVPIQNLFDVADEEAEEGGISDDLLTCDSDFLAKQREIYLAKYLDPFEELPLQDSRRKENSTESHDEANFDQLCNQLRELDHDHSQAYFNEDERGPEVTQEEVEICRQKYKRMNNLVKKFACQPQPWANAEPSMSLNDIPEHPDPFKVMLDSEVGWKEFMDEVRGEVSQMKLLTENAVCQPSERENLTSLDQFAGAVEKETGIPFDEEFCVRMADVEAGRDDDVLLTQHDDNSDTDEDLESDTERSISADDVIDENTRWSDAHLLISGVELSKPKPAKPKITSTDPAAFNLELGLKDYVESKTQLLLSQIHDDGTVGRKYKAEDVSSVVYPKRSYDWIDMEPREYIVLEREGGKRKRRDIILQYYEILDDKVCRLVEYDTAEYPIVQKHDGDYYLKLFLPNLLEKPDCQVEPALAETAKELEKEPRLTVEPQTRKEMLKRRKMHRWERWAEDNPQFFTPITEEPVGSATDTVDVLETPHEQRKNLTDDVDATSDVIQPGSNPLNVQDTNHPPVETQEQLAGKCVDITREEEVENEERKKDKSSKNDKKKKKKRKDSSSSDDLEMLEKRSEARLGLRK